MKAVIQRVSSASVAKASNLEVVGKIDKGLFVLLGIKNSDTKEKAIQMAQRILKLRVFEETSGKMGRSVVDEKADILLVSQFTLIADTSAGNRPSFTKAMNSDDALVLYNEVGHELEKHVAVSYGSFGNYMNIKLELSGPVTIDLEV